MTGNFRLPTSLWWSKVFSRSWGTRTSTTSLLNAQGSTFNDLTLQTLLGSISLIRGNHFDETKATRFTGVRVTHDLALLNITILLKETRNLFFEKTWVDTSNEKVRAWVDCTIILRAWSTIVLWSAASLLCQNVLFVVRK